MKQQDAVQVSVGGITFYIRPFPAFKSANIFGQLTKIITPVAGGLLSLVGGSGDEKSIFDLNLEEAAPALAGAVSGLSGSIVETLLSQLLVDYGNIAYDDPETGNTMKLTMDKANELFCGEIQDMFILSRTKTEKPGISRDCKEKGCSKAAFTPMITPYSPKTPDI